MSDEELDQGLDHVPEPEQEKDSTNWKSWYIGLIVFLVVQIAVYLWITNSYGSWVELIGLY